VNADPKLTQTETSPTEADLRSYAQPAAIPAALHHHEMSRLELWLHRVTVLLFVFVCAVVGVLLIILPWRPEWTDNRLLLTYPSLRAVVANGFFRGFCTGLGVLDIWIGFWEAIHYHEGERS